MPFPSTLHICIGSEVFFFFLSFPERPKIYLALCILPYLHVVSLQLCYGWVLILFFLHMRVRHMSLAPGHTRNKPVEVGLRSRPDSSPCTVYTRMTYKRLTERGVYTKPLPLTQKAGSRDGAFPGKGPCGRRTRHRDRTSC